MQTLHFDIVINAPVAKVWDVMLGEATYQLWTAIFMPGSTFEGSWQEGAPIRFVSADENGKLGGMFSRIAANRPHEFISIEHLGVIEDGKEVSSGEEAEMWSGAHENYTFEALDDGKTKLSIDVDATGEFKEYMEDAWPKALQKLKELAEA